MAGVSVVYNFFIKVRCYADEMRRGESCVGVKWFVIFIIIYNRVGGAQVSGGCTG